MHCRHVCSLEFNDLGHEGKMHIAEALKVNTAIVVNVEDLMH